MPWVRRGNFTPNKKYVNLREIDFGLSIIRRLDSIAVSDQMHS